MQILAHSTVKDYFTLDYRSVELTPSLKRLSYEKRIHTN